jgi:hypothetical protein
MSNKELGFFSQWLGFLDIWTRRLFVPGHSCERLHSSIQT